MRHYWVVCVLWELQAAGIMKMFRESMCLPMLKSQKWRVRILSKKRNEIRLMQI